MDNVYPIGSFVTALGDNSERLVIQAYYERIYYCQSVQFPNKKMQALFEREIQPLKEQK